MLDRCCSKGLTTYQKVDKQDILPYNISIKTIKEGYK